MGNHANFSWGVAPAPSIPLCIKHDSFFCFVFPSYSLCHSLHLLTFSVFFFLPRNPHLPLTTASTMCLLWTLDIHWMGAWTPLANSIVWLLVLSQKKMGSFFRFPSHSHRAICQLGYGWIRSLHSEAPFKLQQYFFAFRGNLRTSYDKKGVEGHLVLCDAM